MSEQTRQQLRRATLASAAGFESWRQALEQTSHLTINEASIRLGVSRSVLWSDRQAHQVASTREAVAFDPDDPSDTRHSAYGYRAHGCRCEICTRAHAQSHRAWRQKARSYPEPWTHGISGYFGYSCRCEVCVQARHDYDAGRRSQLQ